MYPAIFDFIGLTTKWLRILSLGGNDKIRNHLAANPIAHHSAAWMVHR